MAILPPPPSQEPDKDSYVWINWFQSLHAYLTLVGRLAWTVIDFTGSNITDIATRQHKDLQSIQGGTTDEYYHLTATQHSALIDTKTANTVYAGPVSGPDAVPAFRALVSADFPDPASININGTVGATTPTTGAFTTISATGVATFSAGTVALPSITKSGDTNTGVYFPAADTVGITTGGVQRGAFSSTGLSSAYSILSSGTATQVGVQHSTFGGAYSSIGIGYPEIHIRPNAAYSGAISFTHNGVSDRWVMGIKTADSSLYIARGRNITTATTLATFTTTGLAVTGTLSTTGVSTFAAGTVALPSITTSGDTNTGIYFPAADTIAFTEGGAEAMRINSSGNVGIGTSSPANKLQVIGSGTTAIANIKNTDSFVGGTNYTVPHLYILSGNNTTGNVTRLALGVGSGALVYFDCLMEDAVTSYSSMLVRTRGAGGVAERMRINSSGNVGIGTASPNASAILDAQSTTKGVRMPNMTTGQKNAIAAPAAGLMVYDTTLAKLCVYTTAWETITSL